MDITIVVSIKDQYNQLSFMLENLFTKIPSNLPVIYVTSGPCNNYETNILNKFQPTHPNLSIIHNELNFTRSLLLRNLAIPHIHTKYTLFMFNDVIPLNDQWLVELYHAAEQHPLGMVFQPFIWEKTNDTFAQKQFHAGWNNLFFIHSRNKLYIHHTFNVELKKLGMSALKNMNPTEQPYFIEDHSLLVRTDFIKRCPLFDIHMSYTKEYIDMALTTKINNGLIYFVPKSEVLYILPDSAISQTDLLYYTYRRSEETCASSVEHLKQKWGIEYNYDGIGREFTYKGLNDIKWSREHIPSNKFKQFEMILAMLVAIGYNRFKFPKYESYLTLPQFYQLVDQTHTSFTIQTYRNTVDVLTPIQLDHTERRQALLDGKLFPVIHNDFDEEHITSTNYFQPFTLIQVSCNSEHIPLIWSNMVSLIITHTQSNTIDLYFYLPTINDVDIIYHDNKLFNIPVENITIHHDYLSQFLFDEHSSLNLWAWRPIILSNSTHS